MATVKSPLPSDVQKIAGEALQGALVDTKTNEIPVAQKELIPSLDLEGSLVSLDALHTQDETARTVVLEAGGDYLLTCKKNQPTLWANLQGKVEAPRADFPPRPTHLDPSSHFGKEQGPSGESGHSHR